MKRPVARFEEKSFGMIILLLHNFSAYCYKNISIFRLGTNGVLPRHREIFGSDAMSCQTNELVTIQAYQNATVMPRQLQNCFWKT